MIPSAPAHAWKPGAKNDHVVRPEALHGQAVGRYAGTQQPRGELFRAAGRRIEARVPREVLVLDVEVSAAAAREAQDVVQRGEPDDRPKTSPPR